MVDLKKRTTLKTISGVAAVCATPAIASAASGKYFLEGSVANDIANNVTVPINAGAELSIALSVDSEPTIRLTNNSDQLLIVKHVYPGIIHAGAQTFDINSIFEKCAYAIRAGSSRTIKIQPTNSLVETSFPRERYRNQPQRIVKLTGRDRVGELVNSTRSFYS